MIMSRKSEIMVVDDEENILRFLTRALEKKGYLVHPVCTGEEALKKISRIQPELVITDIVLPDISGIDLLKRIKGRDPEINVILITAYASLDTAISAVRNGASDYLVKPFKVDELCSTVNRALSTKRIILQDAAKEKEFEKKYDYRSLIGVSSQIQEIHQRIEKVAPTDATVLISGESGTGKELVARAIHYHSKRREKPFVSINCAALQDNLLESELFGHDKGSFTGAHVDKMGLLELADQGTFFFDEVGDIPLHLQVKLLRFLQEREVRHVGGLHDIKVDVRIIAATSKNLKAEVENGSFREDLFYRLNVVPISIQPLRERREDIPLLLKHYLEFYSRKYELDHQAEIEGDAFRYLSDEYNWPGNVRELENFVERSLMLSENGRISLEQAHNIQGAEAGPIGKVHADNQEPLHLRSEMEEFEKKLIRNVLQETHGNKFQAAKRLHISRQSLQYKIKKYLLE